MIVGQDRAVEQFSSAWRRGILHHAWLLAGGKGVGKATFAREAAVYVHAMRDLFARLGLRLFDSTLTEEQLHQFRRLAEATTHSVGAGTVSDPEEYVRTNEEFHEYLFMISDNPALLESYRLLDVREHDETRRLHLEQALQERQHLVRQLGHLSDQLHTGRAGTDHDERQPLRPLLRVELREHVIREIAPGISAPDSHPQPCKVFGSQ